MFGSDFHSFVVGEMKTTNIDDVFIPNKADNSIQCDSQEIYGKTVVLPMGGIVSLLCYFYLLWMYFVLNSPVLKRHPTTLAIYKCVFEAFFVEEYIWVPLLKVSSFYIGYTSSSPHRCVATAGAGVLAFLTQFSMIAHELCFLVISMDLRMAYTNPFSSFKQNRLYYSTIVLGFSLVTAGSLMILGPRVYGLSSLGLVWVQSKRESMTPNMTKFILYYFILVFIYAYCMWANFQFNKSSEKGFSRTVSNRTEIMLRSKKYTICYVTYGAVIMFFESISFFSNGQETELNVIPAFLNSWRGLFSLSVILFCNWSDVTWENMNPFRLTLTSESKTAAQIAREKLQLQPHLNSALRAEILYFTTQGIMFSTREYQRLLGSPQHASVKSSDRIDDEHENPLYAFESGHAIRASEKETKAAQRQSKRLSAPLNMTSVGLNGHSSFGESDDLDNFDGELELERLTIAQERAAQGEAYAEGEDVMSRLSQRLTLKLPTPLSLLNRDSTTATEKRNEYNADGSSEHHQHNALHNGTAAYSENGEVELGTTASFTAAAAAAAQRNGGSSSSSASIDTRWQRVQSKASSPLRDTTEPPSYKREDSTASDTIRKTIESVLTSATIAARSAFKAAEQEFRFKDYCPHLFATIRRMCKIDPNEYAASFQTTCKEKFSEGRSGAFMFYSSDEQCIAKTCNKEELFALYRIMPEYSSYIAENPNSLIVRFLGAHCITLYGVELYFVVMLNVFPTFPLSERYDLKGSWVNRHGTQNNKRNRARIEKLKQGGSVPTSTPLFMDNDMQSRLYLEPDVGKALLEQINKDVLMLKKMKLMDYSLLIGVKRERFQVLAQNKGGISPLESRTSTVSSSSTSSASLLSSPVPPRRLFFAENDIFKRDIEGGFSARVVEGPGTYYIGIIDVLQEWNMIKKLERFAKVVLKCLDKDGISAVEPDAYADRFWQRAVVDTFDLDDDHEDASGGGMDRDRLVSSLRTGSTIV